MISIKKFFVVALIASVLLSVVSAEEANEEPTSQNGGLASKIIGGIKKAGNAVMSHIQPYLGGFKQGGAAAPAAEEQETSEEQAAEESAPAEETATEESAPAEEPAAEESKTEEAAAEEPKEESKAEEAKEEKSE